MQKDKELGLLDLLVLFSENKISNEEFLTVAKNYENSFLKQIDNCKKIPFDSQDEQSKMDNAVKVLENLLKALNKAKQFIKTNSAKDIERAIEIVQIIYSQAENELKKYNHKSDDNIFLPTIKMKADSFINFISFEGKFSKDKK